MDEYLVKAGLAGLGVVLAAAPLGSFVVWRRMSYFGDSTSHGAILGVALSFWLGVSIYLGILGVALTIALLLSIMTARGLSSDSALGVLAHGALAFGLVAISFQPNVRTNLEAFLFGDILLVWWSDLIWIWTGSIAIFGLLAWRWQRLITTTVNEELALAAGISPRVEKLVLSLALALIVTISIRIVGALLISALLIIPAAAARPLAKTPESMTVWAFLIGAVAVIAGLAASLNFDTPAGPSIVAAAALIFAFTAVFRRN